MPKLALDVYVGWLLSVACKKISDVEHDYRRYSGVTGGDESLPADVSADVAGDHDDIFLVGGAFGG